MLSRSFQVSCLLELLVFHFFFIELLNILPAAFYCSLTVSTTCKRSKDEK
eukprot:m.534292 g.534292  ORF g.534292 m.534292 type:complete len:50 (-) comp227626_c0_seq1:359-508(-)